MDKRDVAATFKFKYVDTSAYRAARRFQTEKSCNDTKAINLGEFVARVPFSHFITLRPYKELSVVGLKNKLKQIIKQIEADIHAPVSYVVGVETYPELNCHACFCSAGNLTRETIIVALQKQYDYDIQEIYSDGVLAYALKCIELDGEWEFGNLELYLKQPTNRYERRRLSRHNKRLQHV